MSGEDPAEARMSELAARLPAYEFYDLIAVGGMGAVYRARQKSLDREVAIKVLTDELSQDPDFRRSFQTEARAMAKLNHPNLIGVYDSGEVDGVLYIVMQYVHGKSLYHSSAGQAIDAPQAARLVRDICAGLAHAHAAGVTHRDIKPANILLTQERQPMVGDFGLAEHFEDAGAGMVMGTPGYTAPEIYENPEGSDQRSDVFSVGIILYELLTGRLPGEEALAPSAICGCNAEMDRICYRATHPDPAQRYQSAKELADDLEAWRNVALGNAGPATAPIMPRPAPVQYAGDSSSHLMRNIVVILVLVGAIFGTWKAIGHKSGKVEEARRAAEADEREFKPVVTEAKVGDQERGGMGSSSEEAGSGGEGDGDSLESLRRALVAGRRNRMPSGGQRHGDSYFLRVATPMAWEEARAFARAHGGHLAVARDEEDLAWLREFVSGRGDATGQHWLGATLSDDGNVRLEDGADTTVSASGKAGSVLAFTDEGEAAASPGTEKHPFVIQWRTNGSNPGSLASEFERVGESVTAGAPVYPLGTVTFGERHLLVVHKEVTAREAGELAALAGADLAVPASKDEADWWAGHLEDLGNEGRFWMGGERAGAAWKWSNGERWSDANWAEGYPTGQGSALLMAVDGTWQNANPSVPLDGALLEWSQDREKAEEEQTQQVAMVEVAVTGLTKDLDQKALDLLAGKEQDRAEAYARNARDFEHALDRWLREQSGRSQETWEPRVQRIKSLTMRTRIPRDLQNKAALNTELLALFKKFRGQEDEIQGKFKDGVEELQTAYLKRLEVMKKEAEASGDEDVATGLAGAIRGRNALGDWLAHLGFESDELKVQPSGFSPLVGLWNWQGGGRVLVMEDGTARSHKGLMGRWQIETPATETEPARYLIEWDKEGWWDRFRISDDGSRLIGSDKFQNQFVHQRANLDGLPAEPTRGDDDDPIVGRWIWVNAECAIISADGTVVCPQEGKAGTWELVSDRGGKRSYELEWENFEFIDKVTMDESGRFLDGDCTGGWTVHGYRVPSE